MSKNIPKTQKILAYCEGLNEEIDELVTQLEQKVKNIKIYIKEIERAL